MIVHVEIVGVSGAGKTSLIEAVVPLLRSRGLRVGTVKHASHGFDLDRPGSDSDRHRGAGASPVLLVGKGEAALQWTLEGESLEELLDGHFGGCDVVLVEGFGSVPGPKILVHRAGLEPKLPFDPSDVMAAVTDEPLGFGVEVGPEEVDAVADLIEGLAPTRSGGGGSPGG